MANMKVLLLLFLAVSVQFCLCLGDEVVEQAKEGAQVAQEKSESWAGWAYDKVKNLGMKEDEKDQIVENVKFQVENVGEKMTEAKDAVKVKAAEAKEKAIEEKNKHDDAVQRERSSEKQAEYLASWEDENRKKNIESETKEKLKEAVDEVKVKAANAYDEAKQHMSKASTVAAETYGEAKQKVGEAYHSKSNEMASQGAKAHSEAAMAKAEKEKTS